MTVKCPVRAITVGVRLPIHDCRTVEQSVSDQSRVRMRDSKRKQPQRRKHDSGRV